MENPKKILDKISGKIAVGVSGGADSMCLVSLILECNNIAKEDVTVLHIDHGLRATSLRDRDLVVTFCKEKGLRVQVFSPDIRSGARLKRRSIETEARLVRHAIFEDFCKNSGARLVLAHNRDDQAETILMHIFRGCGLAGLNGMTDGLRGGIIRPLISVSKAEIYEYVKAHNIPYFEDETNADEAYSRNFIRALLPQIETKYPGAKNNLLSLSSIAFKTQEYIDSQLDNHLFLREGDAVLLDKAALTGFLAPFYVMRAVFDAGLKVDLERKHIDAIIALKDKSNGSSINLPHSLVAFCERDSIAFCFACKTTAEAVAFKKGETVFGDAIIKVEGAEFKKEDGTAKYRRVLYADFDVLDGAVIRFRTDGDRFKPFGGGQKKLKEYLNDKHIPNRIKDTLPLICKGSEVLAIVGVEISDKIKITDATKNSVSVKIERI